MPFTPDTKTSFVADSFTPDNTTFTPDKPKKSEGLTLSKIITTLDKPSRGLWTSMEEIRKQNTGEKPFSVMERFKSFGQGLTKGTEPSGDIINRMYAEEGVSGIPGLGMATNIATDPLTYTATPIAKGIGALIKPTVKGAIKTGGQVVEKFPKVGQAIEKVSETFAPLGKQLKRAFTNTTGIKELDSLVKKYTLERDYLKGESLDFGIKVRNTMQDISKATGQSIDNVSKEVVNLIELPGEVTPTIQGTQELANSLKGHFSDMLTKEMKAGVPISELAQEGGVRGIEYFPRITTKEAEEYLRSASRSGWGTRAWNPTIKNALQRQTGDFTLNEFNQLIKENGLDAIGGKNIEEFFMKNPAYASAIRGVRSAKATTSAGFLNDAGNVFGKTVEAPTFWKEASSELQKILPNLKGKKFDPIVLDEINRVYTKILNPQEVGKMVQVFDSVQNYWKKWTLMPFAKYHLRNVMGNMWNNYLAGVTDPTSYVKAGQLQEYAKTGKATSLKSFGKQFFTEEQARELILNAKKQGITKTGQYTADIPQEIEKAVSAKFTPTGAGMELAGTLEDNAKLAHFINKIETGMSIEDAAISTKKYLFDYGDVTPFEKQILKRAMPFYTWSRKNIPLQLEKLVTEPSKFNPIAKFLGSRDEKDLKRLKLTNPSLYGRVPSELKRNKKSVTYLPLEGLIPGTDVGKVLDIPNMITELTTPYAKTPIELMMNKSFFTGKEIQKYPKETQEFLRMDIPVKWKYAITTTLPFSRMLNEIDKADKQIRKTEPSKVPAPDEAAISQLLASTYKVPLSELKIKAQKKIQSNIKDLISFRNWAAKNKRPKELKAINQTIIETRKYLTK